MEEYEGTKAMLARRANFIEEHQAMYLESGGREGHIIELSAVGARNMLPCLLLKTIGRKSGEPRVTPLIYGCYGGEWVVIGSKGGALEHPAWFHNLSANPEVFFQVATQCFRATSRVAHGDERAAVWAYMAHHFPPYATYQTVAGDREIPVVMLDPIEEVPVLTKT